MHNDPHQQIREEFADALQGLHNSLAHLLPVGRRDRRLNRDLRHFHQFDIKRAVIHLIVIETQLGCVGLQLVADL